MKALLQRVTSASVEIAAEPVAAIGCGLLVFLGVECGDSKVQAQQLLDRIIDYRIFTDGAGKMNLSLADTRGELLVVPQFTLVADTRKGRRPSFSGAAEPALGQMLFEEFTHRARQRLGQHAVQTGRFGANMQVSLLNDGPVTFWLEIEPARLSPDTTKFSPKTRQDLF